MARKNRNAKQKQEVTATQPEMATTEPVAVVAHDAIAMRAHEIWKNEGFTMGHQAEHWFRAENELRAELANKKSN